MTYSQLAKAMQEELGFVPTRQSVAKYCRQLGIPRRHHGGPVPLSDEDRQAASRRRDQRWRDRLHEDPEVWEAHLERKRAAGKRARARLKKDPVAWEAFLKRRSEYLRDYRRQRRAPVA